MKSQLKIHEKISEGRKSKKNHRCNRCHLKFCTSSGLLLHQKKCKGITKISIINQNKIEQKLNVEKSKKQNKNYLNGKCNFCDEKFETFMQRRIHDELYKKCYKCDFITCISKELEIHENNLHGCQENEQTNKSKQNVEAAPRRSAQPKNNVHRDEKQKECNFCDTKFDTEQQLQIHQHFFDGIPNWKCNQCKFKSCSSLGIEIHKKNMHVTSVEKMDENPRPANPKLKINVHEKEKPRQIVDVHEGEKPKKCTYCDEIFSSTKQLQYHETSFDGKPKKCNNCNFKSCNPIGLKIHEEKMHSCAIEIDKNKQTQSDSKAEKISRSEPTTKINHRVRSPRLEPSMEPNISTIKEVAESSKNQTKHVLPKPKKGQWIVKLYRISLPTTFSDE